MSVLRTTTSFEVVGTFPILIGNYKLNLTSIVLIELNKNYSSKYLIYLSIYYLPFIFYLPIYLSVYPLCIPTYTFGLNDMSVDKGFEIVDSLGSLLL